MDNKINALNAEVNGTKTAQNINDDYIKPEVNNHIPELVNNISQHEQTLQIINFGWSDMHNKLETLGATVYNMQNKVITGEGGFQGIKNKPLMDHRVASNLDKLTNEASDFHMWNLRLKNALNQIDMNYKTAVTMIERAPDSILTYDGWCRKYSGSIHAVTQLSIEAYNKLSNDLYILLADRFTNNQLATIEIEDQDGFFAYFNLYRTHTQTIGLGSLERRDFIMHPPEAKNESEVYDRINNWGRGLKEQEKTIEASQRPLISDPLKMSIIKNIACGSIKEYIKTHEVIMTYDELRSKVLQMSASSKPRIT